MSSKTILFDVVGTLVSYDSLFTSITTRLGPRLSERNIKPSLLGYTWIEVAEREYTYLSISGKYTPFGTVFRALFYRILYMAGVPDPRCFANEEDLDFIMEGYGNLTLRPGAKECIQRLRSAGFRVLCFTAGDKERVAGYFQGAGEGTDIPLQHGDLISCDEVGVAKPDPRAYRAVFEQLVSENDGLVPWFAAGHMWDVAAARRVGYVSLPWILDRKLGLRSAEYRVQANE